MPEGGDLELQVQLEDVSDGVLVTAVVTAPLGECARCLDDFSSSTQVRFCELFAAEASESEDDGYLLDGDLLDLEPALRDALVLELPLSRSAGMIARDCAVGAASSSLTRSPGTATPMTGVSGRR